jgi:hypothetical protein
MSDLDLILLRVSELEAQDLRWFFCQAEGELGLQSGMGLQLERARSAGGRNKGSKPLGSARAKGISDDQAEAALAFARLSRRIARLTAEDYAVLRVHYGPLLPVHRQHEPTHEGTREEAAARAADRPLALFGAHLGLVLHLTALDGVSFDKVLDVATRAGKGKGQRQESAKAKVRAWIAQAEAALVQASAAYAATRHLWHGDVRL